MDQKIEAAFEQAEDHFNKAREALCKPEEDVVPYSVCKSSYEAIISYLSSFLMRNGRDLPESVSVEELLSHCREVDNTFKDLHLAPYYHPKETEDVWMNMDTANDFVDMAQKTRDMVNKSSNVS